MAIYSLHHGSIGRSTHRPGTAAAHLRYVTRESACTALLGQLPADIALERGVLEQWLKTVEKRDRANARVVDKITVALPRELDSSERANLVNDFCARITGGRVPWIAAIHDRNDDAENPHAHIIIRDRTFDTEARFIGTSSKGSTEKFRLWWEQAANEKLAHAGYAGRIDRRSNRERGLPFAPTAHLGAAERLEAKGVPTMKGDLNRRIADANFALAEAIEIARESERHAGRLRKKLPPSIRNAGDASADNDAAMWLTNRKRMLLEFYERATADIEVARYWRIEHVRVGLRFCNKNGAFIDTGDSIVAESGNDSEIAGMLAVARLKGWTSLTFQGSNNFTRRAEAAARAAGFSIDRRSDRAALDLRARVQKEVDRARGGRGR